MLAVVAMLPLLLILGIVIVVVFAKQSPADPELVDELVAVRHAIIGGAAAAATAFARAAVVVVAAAPAQKLASVNLPPG